MASRKPALTDQSLLGSVFNPKKNPAPSGLRHVELKGLKGGRTAKRLAAFNRMSPLSQEVLKRSGQREAYLRGESTLAEAKSELRKVAVNLGIAKPLRPRTPKNTSGGVARFIIESLKTVPTKEPVNESTVNKGVGFLPPDVDITKMTPEEIRRAAGADSDFNVYVDGRLVGNVFWYH